MGKPDYVVSHPDVIYVGHLPHDICLQVYHISDWMIHLAWLDHCPNVVVEAISQKCPVICTDSGGTKELVGNGGLVVPETTQYKYELTDYDNPYSLDLSMLSKVCVEDLSVDMSKIDYVFLDGGHDYETVKNDFIYDYYYNELKKEEFEMALLTIENLKYPISKNNCLIIDDFINVKNNRQLIELLFDSMKTNSDNIKIKVGNTSYKVCINNSINKKIEESLYLLIKSKIKNRFNKFIYEN